LVRLSEVKDYRNPRKVKHKVAVILLFGIFWFVLQKSSRRQANEELTDPIFLNNMRIFSPCLESLPHHDTVNRFLSMIDINELENILAGLIRGFIRSKKFRKYLIDNHIPIAVDGTQKHCYKFLWSEECLERKINGKSQYYCYTLEASLVFHNGMVLPLASEFLGFMQGDEGRNKQDCEIRWQFMITLKDDSLPTVWEEYNALVDFGSNQNNRHCRKWGNRKQKFMWVNDIDYLYDQGTKEQIVHVVVCEEEWEQFDEAAQVVTRHRKFPWISSEPLRWWNLHERCNLGARYRWRIGTG